MRPIDYTRRLEANSKFKKEMLQFLEQQQESFSNFQRTRQKIELGTPHRVKLTKPAKTSGMFGKNYGTFNFDDSSHFILEINIGKRRIRHIATLKDVIFNRF